MTIASTETHHGISGAHMMDVQSTRQHDHTSCNEGYVIYNINNCYRYHNLQLPECPEITSYIHHSNNNGIISSVFSISKQDVHYRYDESSSSHKKHCYLAGDELKSAIHKIITQVSQSINAQIDEIHQSYLQKLIFVLLKDRYYQAQTDAHCSIERRMEDLSHSAVCDKGSVKAWPDGGYAEEDGLTVFEFFSGIG